ncbi:phytanoyl-CoA dioxygenase family protein [Olivibacter sp. SDN3]|uniref:phytanoyl-CoA dioxygenase family protein n=1 Tax=Olivibacter sp. SDN3 TaxID=2764720 RepID=UPI0016514589|nr:phytanoyl-CoA dioxygenase family protein [Olivibacter sp. SDN3]QNL51555.1 phytanoyl-CoA dioxygenase family protein [Olivibacter sp. SDN3]
MEKKAEETVKMSFDRDGYVFIPQFMDAHTFTQLKETLDNFIENIAPGMPAEHAFYEDPVDRKSLKQMFHLSDYDPFFAHLLHDSDFKKLAEVLLGEPIAKGYVEYFNKPPGIGQATPPHQDCYYFMLTPPQAITFWIPIEDVDEENGCLRYVRGSHVKGMRPHGRNNTLGFSQCIVDFGKPEDIANEMPMHAKTGDILVHHGMTIHRADGNHSKTRSRRVIGLVYFGQSAVEDVAAKKAYQEKLKKERQE